MNLGIQTFEVDLVIFKYLLLLIVVTLTYIDLKIGPPVFLKLLSLRSKMLHFSPLCAQNSVKHHPILYPWEFSFTEFYVQVRLYSICLYLACFI